MAKLPSFQFYPGDWMSDVKLRRCSHAARGAWMDILCILHDSDEYGVVRWPLSELAKTASCPLKLLGELVEKEVLRGGDNGLQNPYVYTPRSGRKDGEPQELVKATDKPVWFSGRLVKDAYRRTHKGASTRFGVKQDLSTKPTQNCAPSQRHGEGKSDGSSSSSSSSTSYTPISPKGTEGVLGELQIPANLEGEQARKLIELYAQFQKKKNRFDPVAFQMMLQHLASFARRKAMGLLSAWVERSRFIPDYTVDWELYAPPERTRSDPDPLAGTIRKPRIQVPL